MNLLNILMKTFCFKECLILTLLSTLSIHCLAQHDTIRIFHKKLDTLKFKTSNTLSGYWNNANNTNTVLYNVGTVNTLSNKSHKLLYLSMNYVYGIQKEKTSNNDFSCLLNNTLNKNRTIFEFAVIQFDKSYSLNILYRIQSGAGLGINIIKSKKIDIEFSSGLIYDYNMYNVIGSHNTTRISNRFKLNYKSKIFNFESTTYYQPSIENNVDYVFKTINTMSIKINKWLDIHTNLTSNIVSLTNKNNIIQTVGFTVTF